MRNKKKVAVIGTVGIPAKYGGFETLTEYLTKELHQKFDFTIFCSGKSYPDKMSRYNGARLVYLPLQANGKQSIPYDIWAIIRSLFFADTLLILGVSGCIILPVIRLFSKKRIIINIDGLEWRRDKWIKIAKRFLKFSEKMAVRYANEVIADNVGIQNYVGDAYHKKSVLIPYGADHSRREDITEALFEEHSFLKKPYAFKVCRIEPENNIQLILEAFAKHPTLDLVLIGNWQNSPYGQQLKLRFKDYAHIHLLDPIYEQERLNALRSNCTVYVHGHSAGGTNPSLVEAMYLALPILCFDVTYNRFTTANQALYFKDSEELIKLLNSISEKELKEVAENMKIIAGKEYMWAGIAQKYSQIF